MASAACLESALITYMPTLRSGVGPETDACRYFAICQDMTGDFSGDLDYGDLNRAAF